MKLPYLYPTERKTLLISSLGGINRKEPFSPGDLESSLNVCCGTPAAKTGDGTKTLFAFSGKPESFCLCEKAAYTVGRSLYYGTTLQYSDLLPGKKTLVSFGNRLIVFPDGFYIDTKSVNSQGIAQIKGYLTQRYDLDEEPVCVYPCPLEDFENVIIRSSEPGVQGDIYWLDVSLQPNVLKHRADASSEWETVETPYTAISGIGIGYGLYKNNTVFIESSIEDLSGAYRIEALNDDVIVISKFTVNFAELTPGAASFSLERRIPRVDFACSYGNRIYACRYGTGSDGSKVNEIYACGLGDPFDWFSFGTSPGDPYCASVSRPGAFTGVAVQMGCPVFFKENALFRLLGDRPSNYKLNEYDYPGVMEGAEGSLCRSGNVLYYLTKKGLFAYDGGVPTCVSLRLGDRKYVSGVCGAVFGKLLCSFFDGEKTDSFVYSSQKGIWDGFAEKQIDFIAGKDDSFVFVCEDGENILCREYGISVPFPDGEEWMIETREFGRETFEYGYAKRLFLRMDAQTESAVSLFADFDGSGFVLCDARSPDGSGVFEFSIPARRHDKMKLMLKGEGKATLYAMSFEYENAKGRRRN